MENSDYSIECCAVDGNPDARRYLATVVVEVAFSLKLEAENRAWACEEAIAQVKAAQFLLTDGGEAHSVEIRGCNAIAL